MAKDKLVLLTDCPWKYPKCGPALGKGALDHYPLMNGKQIKAFFEKLGSVTADFENVAIFNWVVNPRMELFFDCVKLMKAHGYRYSTKAFAWIKLNADGTPFKGTGNYTGANEEGVWLLVKGSMPPVEKLVASVLQCPKTKHSEKPEEIRSRIERMYPPEHENSYKHIEIFGRKIHPNWQVIGNEVQDGMDVMSAIEVIRQPFQLATQCQS